MQGIVASLLRAEVARSVEQPKQLARLSKVDRARLELLGVIEQILIAGDDRLGVRLPGQRKEGSSASSFGQTTTSNARSSSASNTSLGGLSLCGSTIPDANAFGSRTSRFNPRLAASLRPPRAPHARL